MVGTSIESWAATINGLMASILRIINSPDMMYNKMMESCPDTLAAAIKATSISLITLFFLIDFCGKSVDLKWVTWENVLMFFMKLVVAKILLQNADMLMGVIHNGFASMLKGVSVADLYRVIPTNPAKAMYGTFLSEADVNSVLNKSHVSWWDISPVGTWLMVQIQGLIMQIIMIAIMVIVLARFLELTIYTLSAPLALSTLACDGLTDVGKNFLKSYAACCIHAIVIVIIVVAYKALNTALTDTYITTALGAIAGLIKVFILGGAIMKSEQWSKRICGAM